MDLGGEADHDHDEIPQEVVETDLDQQLSILIRVLGRGKDRTQQNVHRRSICKTVLMLTKRDLCTNKYMTKRREMHGQVSSRLRRSLGNQLSKECKTGFNRGITKGLRTSNI